MSFSKKVLFQLRGCGHPQNDAMPSIFPDSISLSIGLSNEVPYVSELFWDDSQNTGCSNIKWLK